jgi:hypothetical protein
MGYRSEGQTSPFAFNYSYVNGIELSSPYQWGKFPWSIINKEEAVIDKVEREGKSRQKRCHVRRYELS